MEIGGPGGEGITIRIGSTQQWRKQISNRHWRQRHKNAPLANLNLDPAAFRPDQSVVLSGTPLPYLGDPEGAFEASVGAAEGRVEPCQPISRPNDEPTDEILREDEEQARHDPKFREATTGQR
jgi:hypothetical protein